MSESLSGRKKRHLDVCLDPDSGIETGSSGLRDIRFPHTTLPRVNSGDIDLRADFLGYTQDLPVMISCMTGGSDDGYRLNRLLAGVAGERRIAFGLGSIRVMLRHPETTGHFTLKDLCPDSPLLANIGAAQLSEFSPEVLGEAVRRLEADGLYVHLNPAQELFQTGGDDNFASWTDALYRLIDTLAVPVLVKETGAGIPPADGMALLRRGAGYVDIAGTGGTDWVAVETVRESDGESVDHGFLNWGESTAELLWAYRILRDSSEEDRTLVRNRLIASGGLRRPRDFAVSLAAGAHIAAAALPFLRHAAARGADGVHAYLDTLDHGIRSAVVLSGAASLEDFRTSDLTASREIERRADYLALRWKSGLSGTASTVSVEPD